MAANPGVRIRLVALPTEHGGWSMLAAPLLLGLLVAPSPAGGWLVCFGLGGFLTRQPMRLALADLRRAKRYPRTAWALGFATLYGVAAACGLLMAAWTARGPFWVPLIAMTLFGSMQFSHDLVGKGRAFWPEALGTASLSLLAAAVVLATGKDWLLAATLAFVIAAQEVPSIVYAATRLRMARGQQAEPRAAIVWHVASLLVVAIVRWPLAAVFLLLLARCVWGLSPRAMKLPTPIVGLQEVGYSLLVVLATALLVR